MRVVVLLLLAAVLSPGVANASTASVDADGPAHYDAERGEMNEVVGSVDGDLLTLQDAGASITAGEGCSSVTIHEVTCGAQAGITVHLKDKGDTFTGISGDSWLVFAGRGPDTLTAHRQQFCSALFGGKGPDHLEGTNLDGGDGDDMLIGTPHRDYLSGGAGTDRLLGAEGRDTLLGGFGPDHIEAGRGTDHVFAGFGDDRVFGGVGADELWGHPGEDRLDGGAGDDRLDGDHRPGEIEIGEASDLLLGRGGDDRFNARDGLVDRIRGGSGADRALVDPELDIWTSIQTIL